MMMWYVRYGPGLIAAIVEHGGHLSFAERFVAYRCSWIDRVSVEWFNALLTDSAVDHSADKRTAVDAMTERVASGSE